MHGADFPSVERSLAPGVATFVSEVDRPGHDWLIRLTGGDASLIPLHGATALREKTEILAEPLQHTVIARQHECFAVLI